MSDKDDLIMSIEELGKSRREKESKLREAVKRVSVNRRIARGKSSRPN